MRWIAVVALCLAVAPRARADDDWTVRRDPFDAGVVRKYKAILARDPHDAGALRELVAMYRRHRTLAQLDAEYRARLAGGAEREDWATLVVLARLPTTSRADADAWWARALAARPDDARGWLAAGERAAAPRRPAMPTGAPRSTPRRPHEARRARQLVAAARGDADGVDAAYAELIALAPRDGRLWLERGEAQLAAERHAAALATLADAAARLAADPERRFAALTGQGLALERLGRLDDAIAHYARTLDAVPRGSYLARELAARVVGAERKRGTLGAAIAWLERRGPERARGYFEWVMLGELHEEIADPERAIAAYRRALAKAPTEVATQRKLIALLDAHRPDEALAQHEAAARVAPGDADLQLALARRYHPDQLAKALATLARLARRLPRDARARGTIAALYTQWERHDLAVGEYEAVAALEPHDLDHAVALGEAYWRAGEREKARAAWARLSRAGTAATTLRHGDVLVMHEQWDDAAIAYTRALALDGANLAALRGRARAHDELARYPDAVADAQRAVALIGHATRQDGLRERHLLVRVLERAYARGSRGLLSAALARWQFAFEHGDVAAGYLLAEHYLRHAREAPHDLLVALYRRAPDDDSLGLAVARSYVARKEFAPARAELEGIARRTPARADEIARLLAQLDTDRARAELEALWDEEGLSRYEREARAARGDGLELVARRRRLGARLGVGAGVHGPGGALLGLGLYRTRRVARDTALVTRFDWTRRDDEMESIGAVAASVGLTRRVARARRFELAAGIAPRLELRYGRDAERTSWGRVGLAGDATLELLPRALPATLGVRFHQTLTDPARGSALVLELGFEVR